MNIVCAFHLVHKSIGKRSLNLIVLVCYVSICLSRWWLSDSWLWWKICWTDGYIIAMSPMSFSSRCEWICPSQRYLWCMMELRQVKSNRGIIAHNDIALLNLACRTFWLPVMFALDGAGSARRLLKYCTNAENRLSLSHGTLEARYKSAYRICPISVSILLARTSDSSGHWWTYHHRVSWLCV